MKTREKCIFGMILMVLAMVSVENADPEFDEDNTNWILASKTVLMMKHLPKSVNYTVREYYESWNLVYEEELARKDLANLIAPFIDRRLENYRRFRRPTLYFSIKIDDCGAGNWRNMTVLSEVEDLKHSAIYWDVDYCGSETVMTWCDMGPMMKTRMIAYTQIAKTQIPLTANISAECPPTLWSRFYLTLFKMHHETENDSLYKWPFYVLVGIAVLLTFSCFSTIFFLMYRRYHRNRKDNYYRYHYMNTPQVPQKRSQTSTATVIELKMDDMPKRK